jgi:hypothetical protein
MKGRTMNSKRRDIKSLCLILGLTMLAAGAALTVLWLWLQFH